MKIKQKHNIILYVILSILGIFTVYQYFYADTVIFLICAVSVVFMYWFSNKDILTRTIPAIPVYAAMGVIFLLRFCYMCENTVERVPVFIVKSIIVFLVLHILSKLLCGKIGNGDFDIAYTIYLCVGITGLFYAFTAACVLVLIRSLPIIVKKHKNLKSCSIPLIPYMYAGYLTVLLFEKELIFI